MSQRVYDLEISSYKFELLVQWKLLILLELEEPVGPEIIHPNLVFLNSYRLMLFAFFDFTLNNSCVDFTAQ